MRIKFSFFQMVFVCCFLLLTGHAQAGINPFTKAKVYNFGDKFPWYYKDGSVTKSGSRKQGGDTLYYHLNITENRLRLRFSKDDPSGELEHTRDVPGLEIHGVEVDGQTMPRFEWCIANQETISRILKPRAVVVNDTCSNNGDGDFVILLDGPSLNQIRHAREISFIVAPYGRPIRLNFTMDGFRSAMSELELAQRKARMAEAPPKPAPVKAKPRPAPEKKVVAKPKPKPKPKPAPVKECVANPPEEFRSQIKAETYPCKNNRKKLAAYERINSQVDALRKKRAEEEEKKKELAAVRKEEKVITAREKEWKEQQKDMWVKRCMVHWKKGRSPCFCQKYLNEAPPGVVDTCGK